MPARRVFNHRRRIHVDSIPDPIRLALLKDARKRKVSVNYMAQSILLKRYRIDIPCIAGTPHETEADPLLLKIPEELHYEVRQHAARSGATMRAVVIDGLARHYDLSEHAVPLTRERSYHA